MSGTPVKVVELVAEVDRARQRDRERRREHDRERRRGERAGRAGQVHLAVQRRGIQRRGRRWPSRPWCRYPMRDWSTASRSRRGSGQSTEVGSVSLTDDGVACPAPWVRSVAICTCLSVLSRVAVTLNTGENGSDAQPVIRQRRARGADRGVAVGAARHREVGRGARAAGREAQAVEGAVDLVDRDRRRDAGHRVRVRDVREGDVQALAGRVAGAAQDDGGGRRRAREYVLLPGPCTDT